MPRGWFITFEGGEGAGKSTQIGLLLDHLEGRGFPTVVTREPGGTELAEAVRAVLLDPAFEPDALTEIFLLEAARHDHVRRVIAPAMERGEVVVCDRFTDSSLVYQGHVGGVGVEAVAELNRLAVGELEPDLTIVLDLDPSEGLRRARRRNAEGGREEARIDEQPEAYHRGVREGFLLLARRYPDRVKAVDARGGSEEVCGRVLAVLPEALR